MSILLVSCDTYTSEYNTSSLIVVSGGVIEGKTCNINLKYALDRDYKEVPVKDAIIEVSSSSGESEQIPHDSDGNYIGDSIIGEINTTYSINIKVDGKSYSGSSKLYPISSETESGAKAYSYIDKGYGYENKIIYGIKPPSNSKYFISKWDIVEVYTSDRYNNSLYLLQQKQEGEDSISFSIDKDIPWNLFDLTVTIYSVDSVAYSYYQQLNKRISDGTTPNPTNLTSNLGHGILGTFLASSNIDTTFIFRDNDSRN